MTLEEEEARSRIGMEIRSLHPAAFKTGEWAEILGVHHRVDPDRWCYQLIWPDGSTDIWPCEDPTAEYQLRGERLQLELVPKPQRDVAEGASSEHSWHLDFGETKMGMPDYTRVRIICHCGWQSSWRADADQAVTEWDKHTVEVAPSVSTRLDGA